MRDRPSLSDGRILRRLTDLQKCVWLVLQRELDGRDQSGGDAEADASTRTWSRSVVRSNGVRRDEIGRRHPH
jgi:hypothetical protein